MKVSEIMPLSIIYQYKLHYTFYSDYIQCFRLTLLCVHAGSGDLAALGILEDGFKPDLEVHHLHSCSYIL